MSGISVGRRDIDSCSRTDRHSAFQIEDSVSAGPFYRYLAICRVMSILYPLKTFRDNRTYLK